MFDKIQRIFFELYFKNPQLRSSIPNPAQNFIKLNSDWYMVDYLPSHQIDSVINSHYLKGDFKKIHESFYLKGQHQQQKAFQIMMQNYPKDVFQKFLVNNLKIPE